MNRLKGDYYLSKELPVGALRLDWRKLSPSYLSPLGIPELALAANVKTSIATPLGRVAVTDRIFNIINHPLFQRLRNIPQLEFCYLLYPGAKHSRLLHSLTSFDLARQYLSNLLNDPTFRLVVEPAEIEAALLWALLHDIGHYPLSHMFEDFSEEEHSSRLDTAIPTDEDLFWSFVHPNAANRSPFTHRFGPVIEEELHIRSTRVREGEITPLYDLLQRNFQHQSLDALHAIVFPDKYEARHRMLAGLISSAIDVDKVAYLSDDSAATGVGYGLGMDIDALLASLQAPREDDLERAREPVIAISDKGLPAAESIVLARYWMLKRVYWHHTNRAVMAMVKFAIALLRRSDGLIFTDYLRENLFGTEVEATRYLARRVDTAIDAGGLATTRPVRNPLYGLLDGERFIYKRVFTLTHGPEDADRRLYDRLAFHRWDELDAIVEEIARTIESHLREVGRVHAGDILIDVPVKRREHMGGKVLVYFRSDPSRGRDLFAESASVSPILANLPQAFDQHVKKCRVFVHPALFERLEPHLDRVQVAIRDALAQYLQV